MQLSLVDATLRLEFSKIRLKNLYAISEEEVLRVFVGLGLIKNTMVCANCGNRMRINKRSKLADGIWWACNDKKGKVCSHKSIRSGSFFANSNLPFKQALLLFYMWAQDFNNKQAVHELNLSEHVIVDWFRMCREVCENYCNNQESIGGNFSVIEIDETCISRRKYNRGRMRIGAQQWIFGGIERGPGGKAFAFQVPDRKKKTLLKLIRKHIKVGTTIISDDWPAYRKLGRTIGRYVGYKHYTICHKRLFARIEDDKRIHTNKVEGFWMHTKHKIKRMFGTSRLHIEFYVAEAVFRQNCRADNKNILDAFFDRLGMIYSLVI